MERAIKASKSVNKNAAMETAKVAKVGIDNVQEDLEYLQKRVKLMERKIKEVKRFVEERELLITILEINTG